MTDYSYSPQTTPTDDAKKITSEPHGSNTLDTRPAQHRKKTLQRVPVWYRPKTLRKLSQKRAPTMFESISFREIMRTFFLRVFGFL